MAKPLDDRIAAAMENTARAATVKDLVAEIETAVSTAQTELAQHEATAISPTVSETDADAAADAAAKLTRRIHRLNGKRDALAARLKEIETSYRRRAVTTEWTAAKEERDKLQSDLLDRWPALQAEMVDLLRRLAKSDDRIAAANRRQEYSLGVLESAEVGARGCTPLFRHPKMMGLFMQSIKEVQLPRFFARDCDPSTYGAQAWPLPDAGAAVNANIGANFAEIEAAARRYRGE